MEESSQMLHSLRNLFCHAWATLVAALGTTTLSIVLFSFTIPVLIFFATLAFKWRDQRKTAAVMKQVIKGSLLSLQTIIPSVIYLVAWVSLITWAIFTTVSKDHRALLARITQLRKERDAYKQLVSDRDTKITDLQEKLNKAQQNSHPARVALPANTPAPAPNLASIRIASQRQVPSTDPNLPYALEVVVQTDRPIQPVAFALICDGMVGKGDAGFANGGEYSKQKYGVAQDPHAFLFEWQSPAFTPDKPILVTLTSKTYIRAISIQRINYSWP